jgi:uncharacterized membrane protein YdjX (TVP38/TMEM64 family)
MVSQADVQWSDPSQVAAWLGHLGWRGVLLYIAFTAAAIVISPIPSTPITIAAGAVWGALPAGFYGITGVFLGSVGAYAIGRSLGRSAVKALTGKVIHLSNHRGELYLGVLVFVMHLIPVMPYELISYGAGISGMAFPIYALTAFLGIVPCTFFLTKMGAAFTVNLPMAIALIIGFLTMVVLLPMGIRRYNWLGLRDVIRLE